ncbi:NAD-dependent epimerase/dehydratase family protein [candidate division TA06 bacterium]|uniref:NAD-dependent epimerase/dehydratase family protein n=1 Tax=candidate division TA06 bacterium TaxID=2250710 RepID=A0A933I7Q0_UNCT6|nr:NAD-dependent epimerase/dehydratase family protein [candidate division TA06 bacterium]
MPENLSQNRKPLALVTGVTGFIGSHLAEALLKEGFRVKALVRPTSDLRWIKGLEMELLSGSLHDSKFLEQAAAGADYIFHLAGAVKVKNPRDFYLHNAQATLNLAKAAVATASGLKRFLFVSSQAAAGPAECLQRPVCERDQCRPLSNYGQSKLQAERELLGLSGNLPVTIVRPPSVYGPRDTEVLAYFRWINRGLALLPGLRTRYANLIYVTDLVGGIIAPAKEQKSIGKTYFLAGDRAYSWQEISDAIAQSLGTKPLKIHLPLGLAYFSALMSEAGAAVTLKPGLFTRQKVNEMAQRYWLVSSQAAKEDFGFKCRYDLPQGMAETALWYKQQGWI